MNLTALRGLLDHDGPFTTVHMEASHDTEDADKVGELRWRAIRDGLAAQDSPEPTLAALDDALRRPPAGHGGRLLVAADDEVLLDEPVPAPPFHDARVSMLPYVLPLAGWHRRAVPHVVVMVDRVGADLRAVGADGTMRTADVTGHDHPVHKVRGGGSAHRSLQRRTEETVRQNLAEVARVAASLVRDVDARLLVVGGDPAARSQLRELLPRSCQGITTELDHARGEDVDRQVAELVDACRRGERDETLDRFRTAHGHQLAVEGLANTTAALRDGNVEVLLIDPDDLGDATVWAGTDRSKVAVDRDDLHRVGVSERVHTRADEVLPAAAICVGADVIATTADDRAFGLEDGVGALLRHA